MISKLGPTLACTTLATALVAAGVVWLPGASADQPVPNRRDYVSDTFGNATRTTVTGQCVRTTLPDAGMQFRRCDDGEVETAAAPAPAAPAAAHEPEMAAAPKAVEQAPVPAPAPAPAAPVAQEQPVTTPAASADEEVAAAQAQEEASADARYDEEVAATEQAMEPEAETAAAPAAPPEPPAEVAEAPPPAAPPAPPETSLAPPAPPAPPQPRKLRLAADTQFHFDRAELTPSGQAELDRLIGEMGAAQIGAISIVGYTDRIGTDAYNMKLSQRRADTVKQYLVGRSVEANRVQALGRGKNDPITTPATCKGKRGQGLIKCLAPDRRVEVEVVGLVTPPAQ
jgi:outer membrane protein OmpA-like peptidoglycan-associated protein